MLKGWMWGEEATGDDSLPAPSPELLAYVRWCRMDDMHDRVCLMLFEDPSGDGEEGYDHKVLNIKWLWGCPEAQSVEHMVLMELLKKWVAGRLGSVVEKEAVISA